MALYRTPDYVKFRVNWPFSSREEVYHKFRDGGHRGHLGFERLKHFFYLQVTLILSM